nr:glycerophosphodiester phosphodiesterase family protein [Aldersonia kunmingensis]
MKWHRARRRFGDTAFTARRIAEGMRAGASVEIDLMLTADARLAVLHDRQLRRATTGTGRVGAHTADHLRSLRLRDAAGRPTDAHVLIFDDVPSLLAGTGIHPEALLQLDFKQTAEDLNETALESFARAVAPIRRHTILSCGDAVAVALLTERVPDVRIGHDPCHRGAIRRVLRSGEFDRFVADAVNAAPRAEMIYLHHALVLEADRRGHDLVGAFHEAGRRIDAYTIARADADARPAITRLLDLRVDQITTDDPEGLAISTS